MERLRERLAQHSKNAISSNIPQASFRSQSPDLLLPNWYNCTIGELAMAAASNTPRCFRLICTFFLIVAFVGKAHYASADNSFAATAAPSITSFTPSSTPAKSAAVTVTIIGTALTGTLSITWNSHPLSVTSSSATADKCVLPASILTAAASAPFVVTTSGGKATSKTLFTVIGNPTIIKIAPTSGPIGTTITITGTNLTGASLVTFAGGATAAPSGVTATSALVVAPTGAKTGTLKVTTPGGTTASTASFTVVPPPTITSFSPTFVKSGAPATKITVTGTSFVGVSSVTWHGTNLTGVTVSGTTSLAATIPKSSLTSPASSSIVVTTSAGTTSSAKPFVVYSPPIISSVSPAFVVAHAPATIVTIGGSNLSGATSVTWNGHVLTALSVISSTELTAAIPAADLTAAASAPVVVTTPGGAAESEILFAVIGKPTITKLTPTEGSIGTAVTITGTYLTGATAVTFTGGASTSPSSVSAASATVVVPAGAVTGPVSIETPGGTASSPSSFTVLMPPTIVLFTPQSAAQGSAATAIVISGTNFTDIKSVTWAGHALTGISSNGTSSITATIPAADLTTFAAQPIIVTTGGGTATSPLDFVVIGTPPPPPANLP